jgi:hypothetical protein
MKTLKPVLIILLLAITFSSCKNNNTQVNYNPNVLAYRDYIFIEDAFLEPFSTYFKAIDDQEVMNGQQGWIDSAVVIYNSTTNTLKFDYGGVPRKCHDGKFRQGNVWVTFDGPPNQTGTIATFTFEDHRVNLEPLTGVIYSEFLEPVTGMSRFTYNVNSGVISVLDTNQVDTIQLRYNSTFEMTWEEGEGTPGYYGDDLVTISGAARGNLSEGRLGEAEVLVPLNFYIECNWIHSGIHDFKVPSGDVQMGTIDYITEDDCFQQVNFLIEENLFFHMLE